MRRFARLFLVATGAAVLAGCVSGTHGANPPSGNTQAESVAAPSQAAPVDSARSVLPVPDLSYNQREGRAVYGHYCVNCHGEEGAGDGFNAYNLDPRPRALADSTFQAQRSDEDLAGVIRLGGGAMGLSNAMPPWGHTLNTRQIQNVVGYLRLLPRGVY
jgi:mono/diheme cytochrome c family protein